MVYAARRIGYEELQGEMILFVPLLLGNVALQCGSPEAGRQIYTDYKVWTKPKRALLLKYASILQ